MIITKESWYLGYSQIQTDCRADDDGVTGSVLILSNADVDAMCGARILSYMLRSDGISYQLLPCMSDSYMKKVLARKRADDVRAVVLLNVGASRNLTRLFDEQGEGEESLLDPSTKIYVMDCRRPVHLANIHAGENVVIFWDGTTESEDIPSDGDNLSGNDSSSSEEDDDDDDDESSSDDEGEEEFDDDEGEQEFGDDDRQKNNPMDVDEEGDDPVSDNGGDQPESGEQETDYDADRDENDNDKKMSDNDDDDSIGEGHSADNTQDESGEGMEGQQLQQQQSTQPTLTPRELHEERRNRLRAYYSSGTFHGSPAAFVAYEVSLQLRFKEIGDLLWLACVGVTDSYLHSRLDVSGYAELAMFLRQHATRLFPNDMYHRVENTAYAEHLMGGTDDGRSDSQNLTKIGFSDNGRIISENDYRFFLLRHTSLYNAMIHSEFVSTRLQLVTKKGRERLQEFLAKIGMSLEECNQPFAFMKPGLRRRLPVQMRQHAEEYGLENFEYTGFFRVTGFKSLLSAADTSLAVTALLECDRPRGSSASTNGDTEDDIEDADLLQSFNYAYDALSPNGPGGPTAAGNSLGTLVNGGNLSGGTGLGAGIRLAMSVQNTIINTATSLIERSAITRLDHFRYAYITCTSQGDKEGGAASDGIPTGQSVSEEEKQHIFAKPLALTRLAHYLIDLHRVNGKWAGANASPMVLVLLAEKPRTKTYLVVAYEYAEEAGHFVKNRFGKNFELAAQSMQGTFRFDSFDTNVVEVSANDVQRFIEQLHYLMQSM